jgi:hypothetical protein
VEASPYWPPRNDALVCCAWPTQVLVFYSINKLMIENLSKVKTKKVYLPKSKRERLPLSQKVL